MKPYTTTALIAILFGAAVITCTGAVITGAAIGSAPASFLLPLTGTAIVLLGIAALRKGLEHHVMLTSAIKKDDRILRLTREAVRNQDVEKDLKHLVYELSKGNLQAGLGLAHVQGTDVNEMRGRRGGRLYFRRVGPEHYEIVAKSGKDNQEQVISRLRGLYRV
ncbi:MAG: hypothetical protein KJ955_04060 [Nanoarchaeota archaeon]|nr:hypothetical protein [Nanoarchaeota archaeon]